MEEKAMLQQKAVSSLRVHIISPTLHCSDISVICGLLGLLCRRRCPHTTERSEQWSVGEMIWTRSELTAVY